MFQVAMVAIIDHQEVDNREGRYQMDILNNLCNACGAKPTAEGEILLMTQLKAHYRESALFHISRAQRIMEAVL